MQRKGNSGIGVLIIFIAFLLMAVIATAILIQTAGSLQEKSVRTSEDAQNQIVTSAQVIEISATDGTNGNVKWVEYSMKLVPGSEPMDMANSLLSINVNDSSFTYEYAGSDATITNTYDGYYTWNKESVLRGSNCENDYDLDGVTDSITGGLNGNDATLSLASGIVHLGRCNAGAWISNLTSHTYVSEAIGVCRTNNVSNVTLTPANYSKGFFSMEYIQRGVNNVPGHMINGDVVKLFIEAPRNLTSDEIVKINFVPRIGSPTYTVFRMPRILASKKVYLYP